MHRRDFIYTRSSDIMRSIFAILGLALTTSVVALCPYAEQALKNPNFLNEHLRKRGTPTAEEQYEKRQSGPGNVPFTTFNEDQLIDVTGEYAWVAPGPNDIRGPCPGLNALANHGYFPHNGVVPVAVGTSATEQVYGRSRIKSLGLSNNDQVLVWTLQFSYLCTLHLSTEMSCM